jgi:hypothetical protein
MPDYDALRAEATERLGSGRTLAGQADDPAFADARIFDFLYGGNFSSAGDDTVAGDNVNTIVLQVPKEELARGRDPARHPVIGVWSSTSRRRTTVLRGDGKVVERGRYVQVARVGMPLVDEAIIAVRHRDEWHTSGPHRDSRFRRYYTDPIAPRLVNRVYGLPIPDSNPDAAGIQRADLVQFFLTGVPGLNEPAGRVAPGDALRLNMSIAPCAPAACETYSRLGVIGGDFAGFPNGRRPADDVVDVVLQVLEGELVDNPNDLGDDVDANDGSFGERFPYVAPPHSGSAAGGA